MANQWLFFNLKYRKSVYKLCKTLKGVMFLNI